LLFGGDKHFFALEFFILNFNTLLQLTRIVSLFGLSEKNFLQQSRLLNSANSRHPGARNRFGKEMTIERKIGGKEKSF